MIEISDTLKQLRTDLSLRTKLTKALQYPIHISYISIISYKNNKPTSPMT